MGRNANVYPNSLRKSVTYYVRSLRCLAENPLIEILKHKSSCIEARFDAFE